jgi:hypothetical protein
MHDRKSVAHPRPARGSQGRGSEHQAANAARVRQRILALFLPITAVLYVSCEALDPKGTDQVITSTATAVKLLAIATAHPTQLYVAGTLSLFALGALAVSYTAIAALVKGPGWVIATVAALLGGIGAFSGAVYNVLVGVNLAAAATAHISSGAAARFLVTSFNSEFSHVIGYYLYFASEFTAPVVMGFALWRSRSVPRWLTVLFVLGTELAETQSSKGPVVILFMLPFAVALILLAVRLWRAAARSATSATSVTSTASTPAAPASVPPAALLTTTQGS